MLETIINSRQGPSRNKISNFSEINSWKYFSGSAIILVPTVLETSIGCMSRVCSRPRDLICVIVVPGGALSRSLSLSLSLSCYGGSQITYMNSLQKPL